MVRGAERWSCCGWSGSSIEEPEFQMFSIVQGDTKKREFMKNPTKIEKIQVKKFIDRNWTIKTCLLRDSNANYHCLKITSCRWRPPPRMHSFTATTHFKFPLFCVTLCVLHALQNATPSHSADLSKFHSNAELNNTPISRNYWWYQWSLRIPQ